MLTALEEAGLEKAVDVAGRDVAVGDALLANLHLDQRLQPARAPRAVAYQLDVRTELFRLSRDRDRDVIGADGDCRCFAWDEDLDA